MDDVKIPPFTVTRAAIDAIERFGGLVDVDIEPGGCCGAFYAFRIPTPTAEERVLYGCAGAWLAVSARAEAVLAGATLDYSDQVKPPRFRVLSNPNTPNRCPCRRSFGVPWPGPGQHSCRSYLPMPWDDGYEPPREWQRRTGWTRGR